LVANDPSSGIWHYVFPSGLSMNPIKKWFKQWVAQTFLRAEIGALNNQRSAACGALSDILGLVTDCVPVPVVMKNKAGENLLEDYDRPGEIPEHQELHKIAKAVLERVLSAGDTARTGPRWFRHDWEKKAWDDYNSLRVNACASIWPAATVGRARSHAASILSFIDADDSGSEAMKKMAVDRKPLSLHEAVNQVLESQHAIQGKAGSGSVRLGQDAVPALSAECGV